MKRHIHSHLGTMLVLSISLLSSTGLQANQQQLATSIKEVRNEATRTHDQLGATLNALNALTKQGKGDLRPAYEAFAAEIPKTEAAANWTRTRVTQMDSDGQKYFGQWQADIDGIANKSLQKKAQKRLDATKNSYGKVVRALTVAAEKFQPFLSDLTDIKKTLANDVTPSGVKAIRGTVSSANWNYKAVNRAVNDSLEEMKKMEKALSPEIK